MTGAGGHARGSAPGPRSTRGREAGGCPAWSAGEGRLEDSQGGTAGRQLRVGSGAGPKLWECWQEACPLLQICTFSSTPWGSPPNTGPGPTLHSGLRPGGAGAWAVSGSSPASWQSHPRNMGAAPSPLCGTPTYSPIGKRTHE